MLFIAVFTTALACFPVLARSVLVLGSSMAASLATAGAEAAPTQYCNTTHTPTISPTLHQAQLDIITSGVDSSEHSSP